MKLIKSVAIGTLALVALTGCDRRSDQITDRGIGLNQDVGRTEFSGDPAVNPGNVGTGATAQGDPYANNLNDNANADRSSALGTGAATGVGAAAATDSHEGHDHASEDAAAAGTGAAAGAASTESGSGDSGFEDDSEESNEWTEEEYTDEERQDADQNSTHEGTGGTVTPDTSDSTLQEEEETGTLYLDNTSSEADLTERDRGLPIGREPNFYNKTSSEGNPNQM